MNKWMIKDGNKENKIEIVKMYEIEERMNDERIGYLD